MLRPSILLKWCAIAFATWLLLPLLWFALPFPRDDSDQGALGVLLSGKELKRVYRSVAQLPCGRLS